MTRTLHRLLRLRRPDHRGRRPRGHPVARPAREAQRHGPRLLGRTSPWPWPPSAPTRTCGPWWWRPGDPTSRSGSTWWPWPGSPAAEPAATATPPRRWPPGPRPARTEILRLQASVTAVADCPRPGHRRRPRLLHRRRGRPDRRLRHPAGQRRRPVLGPGGQGRHRGRPRAACSGCPPSSARATWPSSPTPARTSPPTRAEAIGLVNQVSPDADVRAGRRPGHGRRDRRQLAAGRPGHQGGPGRRRRTARWPRDWTTWPPGTPAFLHPTTWSRP